MDALMDRSVMVCDTYFSGGSSKKVRPTHIPATMLSL
jgi:hypothetical protein